MRRVIVVFIVVLFIAIIAGVVFALLNSDEKTDGSSSLKDTFPISIFYPDTSPEPGTNNNNSNEPGSGYREETNEFVDEGSALHPIRFSNEEIYGYWIQTGTSTHVQAKTTAFFLTKGGELKKNDGTGEFSLLSYSSYGVPLVVKQNVSGTVAVVKFDSGSTYVYSVARNAWDLLGNSITDFAFSPDGQKLLTLEERGGEMSVVQYDSLTTSKRSAILLRFGAVDLRIQWPSASRAIFTSVPSYFSDGIVLEANLQTKTFRKIAEGSGVSALSSQKNSRIFVFRPETKSKTVAYVYASDGTKQNSYSRMLLDAKCGASFSEPTVWCGAPQLLPAGTFTFPDDYLKRAVFTHDELVEIRLDTGDLVSIPFASDFYVDMSQITHTNGEVFFVNRLDERVYKLEVGPNL